MLVQLKSVPEFPNLLEQIYTTNKICLDRTLQYIRSNDGYAVQCMAVGSIGERSVSALHSIARCMNEDVK